METFEEKVERYMQCDKRTLAEMLALKDLVDENRQYMYYRPYIDTVEPIQPYYHEQEPDVVKPTKTAPYMPLGGDWVITCAV